MNNPLNLRSFKLMSTVVASISPKLLELETSNLVHGFVWGMPSRCTNNFPKSGRSLASRSVQWECDASLANVVIVGCTGADQRTLGNE